MDAQAAADLVTIDYQQVLGRQPDAGGFSNFIALAEAGYDPAAIRAAIVYGSGEAAGVVTVFYAAELGRPPDGPGLSQYLAALAAGESLGDIRTALAQSLEARIDVSNLYGAVLGRPAEASGLAQFQAALGSGYSLATIRASMATSTEAGTLVSAAYTQVLGRVPSAAETAAGQASLAAGGPTQLLATLAGGTEAQGKLAQAYETAFGSTPSASVISALTNELASGTSSSAATQVTERVNGGGGPYNQAYAIGGVPAVGLNYYSYFNATQTIPVSPSGPSAYPAGSDTIVLDLQTVAAAPISFAATLDGKTLGSATVSNVQQASAGLPSNQAQVTFAGAFGAALHDLHLQVTSDPSANALVVATGATFDGSPFLIGAVSTDGSGAVDIYPHPATQTSPITVVY